MWMYLLAQAVEETRRQSRWERRFQALKDGDPVAWTILIGAVLIVFGWPILKKQLGKRESAGNQQQQDRTP